MVFIVSTTGDGEPPDNALQFVKHIKKKTLSSDHYKHLYYALLGKRTLICSVFCANHEIVESTVLISDLLCLYLQL